MYQHDEQEDLHIFLPVDVTAGMRESDFRPGHRVRVRVRVRIGALNLHTHHTYQQHDGAK